MLLIFVLSTAFDNYSSDEQVLIHPALLPALERFPACTTNPNTILQRGDEGNVLRIGVGAGWQGFPGLFLATHSTDAHDTAIGALVGSYSLTSTTPMNKHGQEGIVTFYYNRELQRVELHMQTDVYWHDGTQMTLDDLVFAYEVIAHPDYTGVRFGMAHFIDIVQGVHGYREGEADYISGLVLSNENRSLYIYYSEPLPPSAMFQGGLWLTPIPRHWLTPVIEEVGHSELEWHPRAREEILGFGPFIIENVLPGESLLLVANDNYWQGAPLVCGIDIEFLSSELIPAAMRAGMFDWAAYQVTDISEFEQLNPDNYNLLGWPSGMQNIINFRLGYVYRDRYGFMTLRPRNDNYPITNIAIRRAMLHAIDRSTIAYVVGYGTQVPAASILHPFNAAEFTDMNFEGWVFDLDLANRILDEAGFIRRDAEGYRLNLDGDHMTFVYGQNWNPANDFIVPLNIYNWSLIGLRVEMYGGDFMEWLELVDIVLGDENEPGPLDIFGLGWSLAANPAPHSLWGSDSTFNMPRYTSPEWKQILIDISSEAAWDVDFLADAYARWERAFFEAAVAAPFTWNLDLVAVNNRVTNYSRARVESFTGVPGNMGPLTWGSHIIGLTAPEPYVNTN